MYRTLLECDTYKMMQVEQRSSPLIVRWRAGAGSLILLLTVYYSIYCKDVHTRLRVSIYR